ncbi:MULTISPECIES: SecDF P1 head subdomain-containing protein [unclassified Paenibacillus]|uniref:SecDF P1 head subdomain-containing protein n=1 Tax=unclassified Paenibacillus TaxID=185978 RepID=UPI0036D298D6
MTKELLMDMASFLNHQIKDMGINDYDVRINDRKNTITIILPDGTNEVEVRNLLNNRPNLTFRAPDGSIKMESKDLKPNSAYVVINELQQAGIVVPMLDDNKLEEVTSASIGQELAIYLNDTELSRPRVNAPIIGDSFVISLGFSLEEAKKLEDAINLGTLPLKLTEIANNK